MYPGYPVAASVMHANPREWWLRPVRMAPRDGEHSAVVCTFVYRRPSAARLSRTGVSTRPPNGDN